jgi:threonine dehydrogenase-like Zn-dependent dehydrogenase
MRGVVFDGVGTVRVADLPDPELEAPDDAIVRVTRTAICGSDLHLLHGKAPMEPGEPLGHEAIGVVEAVGTAVRSVHVGDRVAVAFNVACGHCWFCGNGQSALCDDDRIFGYGIFGGGLPGAQAERLRVPNADVSLLRISDGIDDDAAVFVGDVLTSGLYGASLASAGPDDTVAVLGCGPVGFCTIVGL